MLGMSATLVLLTTVLFVVCNATLVSEEYGYYYPSAFRPADGWHFFTGAYRRIGYNVTRPSDQCQLGRVTQGLSGYQSTFFQAATPQQWSRQGFCVAWCNFTDTLNITTSFVLYHCVGGQGGECVGLNSTASGVIALAVFASNTTNYQYINYFTYPASKLGKFSTWQCLASTGSVYLNGDLLYQTGVESKLVSSGVGMKSSYSTSFMQSVDSLVKFVNGTATKFIFCDGGAGQIYCDYGNGDLVDGLYPITRQHYINQTLEVFLTNTFVTNTVYGVLNNYTMPDVNGTLHPCQSSSWGCKPADVPVRTLFLFNGEPAYYNLNFDVLSGYDFMPIQQSGSQYWGSWYYNCPFDLNSINNNRCFNSFSVSYAYLPVRDGCFDMVFRRGYSCCYMYNTHRTQCKGLFTTSQHVAQTTYECGIAILINQQSGSRYCTSKTPPTTTVQDKLNNTFVLDVCVNYTIYSRYGEGIITNITDTLATQEDFLADGGLVLLDNSGAIDIFAVDNVNGRQYYKVNPCGDVNIQGVISNNTLVGYVTTENCTDCQHAEGQYFFYSVNKTHARRKRSVGSVTYCPYASLGSVCFYPDGTLVSIQPESFNGLYTPLLNITTNILVPDSFNLTVTDEYIQTSMEQIQLNCVQYVCGTSQQCRQLFQQYGPVCDNILSILNGVVQQDTVESISMYSKTMPTPTQFASFNSTLNTGDFNVSGFLPNNNNPQSRSFIEDLLFTKIESVGLPTDQKYQECTKGQAVRDLICAQYYNGIMVLPPVITPGMQAVYTGSLVASMMFGGITAAGAIPFATQVQARINHLGITQTVILKNQELLANSFNNALQHMQEGFKATSNALIQIQDVVNQQAAVLNEVMNSLNKNFGAISSVIQDIYKQLDDLSAKAQVDRLITGRLSSLSVLAASKQSEQLKVSQQRQLAQDKVNECVLSQSTRNSFCGEGKHILSIPQSAPNGIVFFHFTYTPQTFRNVTAVVGFCVTKNGSEPYGLVPVNGRGVFIIEDGVYKITSRDMYMPRNITAGDVVVLTSCEANYQSVNYSVVDNFVDDDFDFDDEFEKWWNKTEHLIPDLDEFNYTVPILNITNEIDRIQQAIEGLNQSYVDLEALSILTTYIKWPWYVWLAIAFATIIFILILCWIFFMTGCCGCCCGCFGLIPLMSKCRKKSSYYTTFDDDIVGEQIRPKKSV
uniref:Spike protein n=1 Tax=Bird gammacoronavirus AnasCN24 TaxID=3237959 RepID=A0AB39AD58_9GAMC